MKELLRSKITWKAQVLPLTVTYNHTLLNITSNSKSLAYLKGK